MYQWDMDLFKTELVSDDYCIRYYGIYYREKAELYEAVSCDFDREGEIEGAMVCFN